MTTSLSVNINKVALLRNSRGTNLPDLNQVAKDCETFGAQGITVHPRPDERHIRYSDIPSLKEVVNTELNIEGNPIPKFMRLVLDNKPAQCTLVPDKPGALTSNSGWDTIKHKDFLTDTITALKEAGIRVAIFIDAEEKYLEGAKIVGADRVELYTGIFAQEFLKNKQKAVLAHSRCAQLAAEIGIGLNAGHDLNLDNLSFYKNHVAGLKEVSIGHALISQDALYFGLHNAIQLYLRNLA